MRLRVIEEQSNDEVCRALGISEGNLFVRIHRARKQLLSQARVARTAPIDCSNWVN